MTRRTRLGCKPCKIDRGSKSGIEFGIIMGLNNEAARIKQYDRDGIYDGIKLITKSDIESAWHNGIELQSVMKFLPCHARPASRARAAFLGSP